jgi:hypothetical protein
MINERGVMLLRERARDAYEYSKKEIIVNKILLQELEIARRSQILEMMLKERLRIVDEELWYDEKVGTVFASYEGLLFQLFHVEPGRVGYPECGIVSEWGHKDYLLVYGGKCNLCGKERWSTDIKSLTQLGKILTEGSFEHETWIGSPKIYECRKERIIN